jgi:hypothetical protein
LKKPLQGASQSSVLETEVVEQSFDLPEKIGLCPGTGSIIRGDIDLAGEKAVIGTRDLLDSDTKFHDAAL